MAAPTTCTIQNLNGKFVMNKSLSDDFVALLEFQGVGWMTRKAIGIATVTLHVKQYKDDAGVVHIDIEQTASGGIKGTTELRHLDGVTGEHEDQVFGKVRGQASWVKISDVKHPFLAKGWLPETEQGEAIKSDAESVSNGWKAEQIWGFEEVKGERRYVRHVVITKGGKEKTGRLVYDYLP